MKRRSFLGLLAFLVAGTQLEAKPKTLTNIAKLPNGILKRKPNENIGTLSQEAVKMFDKEVMMAYKETAMLSKNIPGYGGG